MWAKVRFQTNSCRESRHQCMTIQVSCGSTVKVSNGEKSTSTKYVSNLVRLLFHRAKKTPTVPILKTGSSNLQSRTIESSTSVTPSNMKPSLSILKTHSAFTKFKETIMAVFQSKNLDKQDPLISSNSLRTKYVPDSSQKAFGVAINLTRLLQSAVLLEPNTTNNMMKFTSYTVKKLKHFPLTTLCVKETLIIT